METYNIQSILYGAAIVFLLASIYYSYKRRRANSAKAMGVASSKMNVCMGSMLIALGIIPLFINVQSWVHFTVGIVFTLLGLFNLFAGLRNLSLYR